jgi:hypothetical protein
MDIGRWFYMCVGLCLVSLIVWSLDVCTKIRGRSGRDGGVYRPLEAWTKGFKERRKQEIEHLYWWNVTKKLDLRVFQTLENDERAHVRRRTLDL